MMSFRESLDDITDAGISMAESEPNRANNAHSKSESNLLLNRVETAKKMFKKIRKSIHITNPQGLEPANTVLARPVQEEEELPMDNHKETSSLLSFYRHDWFQKGLYRLTLWYMRSGTARLLVIFAAILSCVTYVLDTYATEDMHAYKVFSNIVDVAAFVIFMADYVFNIIFADSKLVYIVSFQGLVDFASLFSILNVFVSENLSFLALFRLMRVLKVMRVFRMTSVMLSIDENILPSASEAIYFDILSLALGILLAWFLFSSLLYTMIQEDADAFVYTLDPTTDLQHDVKFFDCVYIMIVITSTLGFGDYTPADTWGRMFVVVVLFSALTIVPMQVGRLIESIGKNPRYILNSYNPVRGNPQHIVLAANLNSRDFQRLINLLLSEGSNDPEIMEHAAPIAIISSVYPSAQLELLLNHPINVRKVQFFMGNVKNQSDLKRVMAESAKAILIFSDDIDREALEAVDSIIQDDYSLKLKIVSVMNFLEQSAKKRVMEPSVDCGRPTVICQTVSHEVCFSLLNKGVDRIISNNNLKYSMLAYGAMFPGFLSLIYTLTMPSNIYNKKKHVRDSRYWTEGFNFEWGHGFELREVPIEKIGDGMKQLTFSQCCKVLHWWSQGMAICVGVNNYIRGCIGGVLINPERQVKIGDCSSIFVICNDFEMILAMLNTSNMAGILKSFFAEKNKRTTTDGDHRSRKRRSAARAPCLEISGECSIPEATGDAPILLSNKTRVRADSNWITGWMNSPSSSSNSSPLADGIYSPVKMKPILQSLEFKRGPRCFRVEVSRNSRSQSGNSAASAMSPNVEHHPDGPVFTIGDDSHSLGGIIDHSLGKRDSTESFASTATGACEPPTHKMGRFLSFLPEPSIIYGEYDAENADTTRYLVPKRYSDHIVLVCAFQPTYALVRIVAAVETFVSATRSRSDEIIVILSNRAEDIEKRLIKKCRIQGEFFDNKLFFVQGIPNSVRHLRAVDVCFARCVVIIGNEAVVNKNDNSSAHMIGNVESGSDAINSDLYILLAALELDSVLTMHIRHLKENNRAATLPTVIQELYNDTNTVLLPETCSTNSYDDIDTSSRKMSDTGAVCESEDDSTNDDFLGPSGQHNSFFSPSLLQGRVFSAKMFNALTVQMLFNPNIVEFWQVVMGKRRMTNNLKRKLDRKTEEGGIKSGLLGQGVFDQLLVPEGFQGTYKALFELLLSSYGAIALGLFRHDAKLLTHHVAIMPHADSLVGPRDTVFVLLQSTQ